MTRKDRVRYERLLRVRDFANTHQALFSESSEFGRKALAAVTHAIEQIEAHETARHIASGVTPRDKAARREVILDRMARIAHTSKSVTVESGARLRLRMPRRVSDVAIAEAARRFLTLAETYHAQFVGLGMPPSCLTDLREALTAFETAMTDRRVGRAGIAAAAAGITAALREGSDAVRTLDVVVSNAAGDDPTVHAAWTRDRLLVTGRPRPEGESPDGTPAVSQPAVANAAPTVTDVRAGL